MVSKLLKGESFPVLVDQAMVSAGNFLTALVLARTLAPVNYGTFSLLFLALFAINTCHSSLVVYPLTFRGAGSTQQELGRLTGLAFVQTILLSIPLATVICIFAVTLHRSDLMLSLSLAMVAWQLQETARRALLSVLRARQAILPDALCYLGQGVLLILMRPQSLQAIFYLIAVTSIVATAWQAVLVKLSFDRDLRSQSMEYGLYSWRMGRYILAGNALNTFSLQVPSWALAFAFGPLGVAGYQSLLNLVGVANPIIFSANSLLIPVIVRAAKQNIGAARRTAVRHGVQYGMLLVPCFIALMFAPHSIMRLAYGSHASYASLAWLLRPFALAFAIQYVATVIGAYEGGMSRPQTYMWVQIVSILVLVGVGVPLILHSGVAGAVYAMLAASSARLLTFGSIAWTADRRALEEMTAGKFDMNAMMTETPMQAHGSDVPAVQVCVLTYRRPDHLRLTLDSLAAQTLMRSGRAKVSVLVVDNDGGSAEAVVKEHMERVGGDIRFLANRCNGLATGRNLALDSSSFANFVAFIDDDEIARPDWLERLLDAASRYHADVVTGPILPKHVQSPSWVVTGGFFEPRHAESGRLVPHVATNNTLISARVARLFRFDADFNTTGGEDTDYFLRVARQGFPMVWCDEAKVIEKVPVERANLRWILQRAYSDANRFTRSTVRLNRSAKVPLQRFCVGVGGFVTGCALIPAGIFGLHHSARGLQLIARAAGTFAGLSGLSLSYYGGKP